MITFQLLPSSVVLNDRSPRPCHGMLYSITGCNILLSIHQSRHCICCACQHALACRCAAMSNLGMALQVAANKLAGAGGPLQLAAALSWLHRAMLVEAMAVFPLLLWVRTLHQTAHPVLFADSLAVGEDWLGFLLQLIQVWHRIQGRYLGYLLCCALACVGYTVHLGLCLSW